MSFRVLGLLLLSLIFTIGIFSQGKSAPPTDIRVVSEEDLLPSVVKNLPDAENVGDRAVYIRNSAELKKALGERSVFDLIEFVGGTDAASAEYDAGKFLIVDFASPQASIEADTRINARLSETPQNPPVYYKRVGNYAVFVFDPKDEASATALINQVKYEKSVQWLGQDPFLEQKFRQANRIYLETTSNVFISTVIAIVLGIGSAVTLGFSIGMLVFFRRKQRRAHMTAFSDAGGMTRLNLDGLSDVSADRLLKE